MIQIRNDLRKWFCRYFYSERGWEKGLGKKIVVGQSKWIFETKGKCVF